MLADAGAIVDINEYAFALLLIAFIPAGITLIGCRRGGHGLVLSVCSWILTLFSIILMVWSSLCFAWLVEGDSVDFWNIAIPLVFSAMFLWAGWRSRSRIIQNKKNAR